MTRPEAAPTGEQSAARRAAAQREQRAAGTTMPNHAPRGPATTSVASGLSHAIADERAAAKGVPAIAFIGSEHDFGTVSEGEVVEHQFSFENRGQVTLMMGKLTTSCGSCTAALASANVIPAGGHGRIDVVFQTAGYKGKVRREVYIESNDPQRPRVMLTLVGVVRRDIEATPPHIYFSAVRSDATASQSVRVASATGKQFRMTQLTATSAHIRLSETRPAQQGGYEFEVTVGPGLEPGPVSGMILVETDSPYQPRLLLHVFANVVSPG